MKRIALFLIVCDAAFFLHAQDSVTLKNGKSATGKIYRMEDGKIFLKTGNDTIVYIAGELQTIMFCGTVKGAGNSISRSESVVTGTTTPCDEKNNAEKGTVLFRCNMCGGEGSLKVENENGDKNLSDLFMITLGKDNHWWLNREVLTPGNYSWTYSDTYNNTANGKFTIAKGEKKEIVLFEKQK